jgi:uncharacterized protein (TIGR03067 family)
MSYVARLGCTGSNYLRAAVLIVPLLAAFGLTCWKSTDAADDKAASAMKRLEGKWRMFSYELDGGATDVDDLRIAMEFQAGVLTVTKPPIQEKFKVQPVAARPDEEIDFLAIEGERKGQQFECVYRIIDKELQLVWPEDGKRPKDLSTKTNPKIIFVRLKRQ